LVQLKRSRRASSSSCPFLFSVVAPVLAAILLCHLDSFDPAPFPHQDFTHPDPSLKNGHLLQGSEFLGVGQLTAPEDTAYDSKVLLSHLYFANGLAISPDQQSLIYCETPLSKCKRYYIKENKKGNIENFVDIPGLPDNIHYDGDGHFWIASISEITQFWKLAFKYPVVRKFAAIALKYMGKRPTKKNAGVFTVNLEGKLISHYHDPDLMLISSGVKIGTHLYCGSTIYPHIIRLNLAKHPPHPTT
ncbi:protein STRICTOSIDINE SYNTHASE-LIKE 5-like, partial [Manihot esculenta]|uniref:protein STRICTOSIDINE SYNTHASE-LIKE 5-like n=1 Tax=Manihot esculenta TaxID=3983 RepID=UPI001CC42E8C